MLVSPLQAEDGRLGGDLGEPNTASVLWDALVEAPSGLALDELVELVALDKEDCEVVRAELSYIQTRSILIRRY
jgi:hypothetical protein